ncbi:aminoglycoside phosphotransferase [Kribbella flavida DSM 17836]|uniref:Aminoglycoside phosphotransferase n=1 Tax=Kribbella flavida (strain DSM 17836 / JCM 10339 / NBRC 14399) TaxID=479435 RepID=D2PTY5_KRIFD|nr:phosphotransferase [Kribbella flavida]ADB33268.1 aminoglycoside phosphotransferase [Kribbella flavida DSM 17836]
MAETGWRRVDRLDADWAAGEIARLAGVNVVVEGPCGGGEVGAAFVRWEDGRRSVLKWRPGVRLAEFERGPLAVVDVLREVGYPAPRTELAVQVGTAVVTVQELMPGTTVERVDHHLLDQLLELNALQAGRLAGSEMAPLPTYLHEDGPGFCLHGPLREFSARTADLERRISAVGPEVFTGDDAVHVDFHPGNLLQTDGRISAVIDWDGAGRGDRGLDLVTLRFGVRGQGDDVVARLDGLLDELPEDVLRAAWAHMSLRMVDWAIRHFPAGEVDEWVDLADQRL